MVPAEKKKFIYNIIITELKMKSDMSAVLLPSSYKVSHRITVVITSTRKLHYNDFLVYSSLGQQKFQLLV